MTSQSSSSSSFQIAPVAITPQKSSENPTMIRSGYLGVIGGPMFSGKTTFLLDQLKLYADAAEQCGRKVRPLLITTIIDDRKINNCKGVTSHSSQFFGISPKIDVVNVAKLSEVDIKGREIIGVDELQFFEEGSSKIIIDWVEKNNLYVYVVTLTGTSDLDLFGEAHLFFSHWDDFFHKKAICHDCLCEIKNLNKVTPYYSMPSAPFTFKLTATKSKIDVGGADKYIPLCRYHYTSRTKQRESETSEQKMLEICVNQNIVSPTPVKIHNLINS